MPKDITLFNSRGRKPRSANLDRARPGLSPPALRAQLLLFMLIVILTAPVRAEESPVDPGDMPTTQQADGPHPAYAADSHWATELVVAIAGLFVAAMVIGPIVRAEAPDAVPDAMSHEEDPAADQHPDAP